MRLECGCDNYNINVLIRVLIYFFVCLKCVYEPRRNVFVGGMQVSVFWKGEWRGRGVKG